MPNVPPQDFVTREPQRVF